MPKVVLAGLRADAVRLALTCLSIVLGIAFVTGTFLLSGSINQAFNYGYARAAQNVDVAVQQTGSAVYPNATAPPTPPSLLTPSVLDQIQAHVGSDAVVSGQVKGPAPVLDANGQPMRTDGLTGNALAFPADPALYPGSIVAGTGPTGPGDAVIDKDTAAEHKLRVGQTIRVVGHDSAIHTFRLAGIAEYGVDNRANGWTLVGLEPQVVLSLTGKTSYDEIDLHAKGGASQTHLASEAASALGGRPQFTVLTGTQYTKAVLEQRASIAGNVPQILEVFGAVALLVAGFVIYNTFTILVAQRIRQVALLRCIGAGKGQVFAATVAEAALVGLVGSALGVLAGIGVAQALHAVVAAVSSTQLPPGGIVVSGGVIALGMAVGFAVTIVSAVLPARAATNVPPVEALRTQQEVKTTKGRIGRTRVLVAVALGVVGVVLAALGTGQHDLLGGVKLIGGGGALVFAALIVAGPLIVGPMIWALGWLPGRLFGTPTKLAGSNARRNPGRVAATTAALTIGVTLMALFTVTQDSVTVTQSQWIDSHNPYDYSVDPPSTGQTVPFQVTDQLRAKPQLAHVAAVDGTKATLNGTSVDVGAVEASAYGTLFKPVVKSGSLAAFGPGTVALSNEMADSQHVKLGDTITVQTQQSGPVTARVTLIYQVFTGHGIDWYDVLMPRPQFLSTFKPLGDTQVRILAAPGVPTVDSRAAVDSVVSQYPFLHTGSLAEKKDSLTGSADATLQLFTAMLGLAVVIAVLGIANTLSLSVVERTRESALLRALGLSRGQLRRMLSVEAVLMSAVGALMGVALGVGIAAALEALIGRVEGGAVLSVPVLTLVGYVLLAAVAGLVASVLPGRRAASVSIVAAIADS
ncbi:ABC transporter permease [Catenulispora pinisilvae]|uniref:ABC transporter permease n=1 Tax=Catenulispora pinisilvae TaxID=2705253 RepID=UPI001891AE65|nr:FtsX-like permease family protein [Catenulispora pinisilvae]